MGLRRTPLSNHSLHPGCCSHSPVSTAHCKQEGLQLYTPRNKKISSAFKSVSLAFLSRAVFCNHYGYHFRRTHQHGFWCLQNLKKCVQLPGSFDLGGLSALVPLIANRADGSGLPYGVERSTVQQQSRVEEKNSAFLPAPECKVWDGLRTYS